MQSCEAGRKSDVSCACHWTVDVAASNFKLARYRAMADAVPLELPTDRACS
jgi:hypothetical protein